MQIIPKKDITVESNWQKELANCFTTLESLLDYLQIPLDHIDKHSAARKLFPMRVPRPFAMQMNKGDINDPLLKQVMPMADEFEDAEGFVTDPLQEQNSQQKGILHKYKNRALLIVRGGCAVNCRYCFRRHFPYQDHAANKQQWRDALNYIALHKELDEIILSGGDPLMAKDDFLKWLSSEICQIPHIKRLRIHTRLPVVIPSRLDKSFHDWFSSIPLQKVLVLHVNHKNEVSDHLLSNLNKLRGTGTTLLNQAVLLKGINDSAPALKELTEKLFEVGVLPYYLHLLDKVKGASHFDISQQKAIRIMHELVAIQPGFLVPKLVREIANQPSKTLIDLGLAP